jgi:hypothetical protein
MAIDVRLARAALHASGMRSYSTLSLLLPFGREARLQGVLSKRRSVLEAKNYILDSLFRVQKSLEPYALQTAEEAKAALRDTEKRRMIVALGLNRVMLEDEARRFGAEMGESFTGALVELLAEGRVLKVEGGAEGTPEGEIYLAVHRRGRQRYDVSTFNRLLHRGAQYGTILRSRDKNEGERDVSRTYRM